MKKFLVSVLAISMFVGILAAVDPNGAIAYFNNPPGAGCVTVYEHVESDAHTGSSRQFCAGTCDGTCLGSWSASISSLQVGANAEVTLYAHPGCLAPLITFSSDVSNLGDYPCSGAPYCNGTWNDVTRCIKVVANGPTPTRTPSPTSTTNSPTPTGTPTPTRTPTATPTTNTPTPTRTSSPTPTGTPTRAQTPTPTRTLSPTNTPPKPPAGSLVWPPQNGYKVADRVLLRATARDNSGSGLKYVRFIASYDMSNHTLEGYYNPPYYEYDWYMAGVRDQEVGIGLVVEDNNGNIYVMPSEEYRTIIKDTSYVARWKDQWVNTADGQELRGDYIPVQTGDRVQLNIAMTNIGHEFWFDYEHDLTSDVIGVFSADEVGADCRSAPGTNDFEKFRFDHYYGPYGTGIAYLNENLVFQDEDGTFNAWMTVPEDLPSGRYAIRLALAHGTEWVLARESGNNCDYMARVWFGFDVGNPKPRSYYIHQCKSTRDDFWGQGSCGASSVTMAMAAYSKIEPSRYIWGKKGFESPYSWYVSEKFGEFTEESWDYWGGNCSGRTFYGVHGYICPKWSCGCGGYMVKDWGRMKEALAKQGLPAKISQENKKKIIEAVHPESGRGRLVILGTGLCGLSAGHIVLVKGYDLGSDRFIVNDPYGVCGTNGSYNTKKRGEDVLYRWEQFNRSTPKVIIIDDPLPESTRLNIQSAGGMRALSANGYALSPATISVWNLGTAGLLFSQNVLLDSQGGYQRLPLTGITPGMYDITFKPQYYLARQVTTPIYSTTLNLDFTDNGVKPLAAGDIDYYGGDNTINALDAGTLVDFWGQAVTTNPAAARADLDGDGTVGYTDLALLMNNYGLRGEGVVGVGTVALTSVVSISTPSQLELQAAQFTYATGDLFPITITLKTTARTYGAEAIVLYDPKVLAVVDADPFQQGIQITPGNIYPHYQVNNVDPLRGKILLSSRVEPGVTFSGTGTFGVITFRALSANQNTSLRFDFRQDATTDSNVLQANPALDTLVSVVNTSLMVTGSDNIPPVGFFTINGGQEYVSRTVVALNLFAADNYSRVSGVRFSPDGVSWTNWSASAPTYTLTLAGGDGEKPIYVSIRDNSSNAATLTGTVVLDTRPPTGTISITDVYSDVMGIQLTAYDETSEVAQMRVSHDPAFAGVEWVDYVWGAALPIADGTTVYAQYMDSAGNVSDVISATLKTGNYNLYLPLILRQQQ